MRPGQCLPASGIAGWARWRAFVTGAARLSGPERSGCAHCHRHTHHPHGRARPRRRPDAGAAGPCGHAALRHFPRRRRGLHSRERRGDGNRPQHHAQPVRTHLEAHGSALPACAAGKRHALSPVFPGTGRVQCGTHRARLSHPVAVQRCAWRRQPATALLSRLHRCHGEPAGNAGSKARSIPPSSAWWSPTVARWTSWRCSSASNPGR
jgi:hypothetical protein